MVVAGLQLGPLDGSGHADRLGLPAIELDRITVRIGLIARRGGGDQEGAGGGRELKTTPVPSAPA
jgi:hypothetical protein